MEPTKISVSETILKDEAKIDIVAKLRNLMTDDAAITTFMHDESLPNLPVPSLPQTMERYIKSCTPFLNDAELAFTEKVVQDFMSKEGPVLQAKLLQRANQHKNWLEDWWMTYAYLNFRQPLLPLLNIGGPQTLHLSSWPPSYDNAIFYAALFAYTGLCFYQILREERIHPQSSVKGSKLSMEQFRRFYNTCRIPGVGSDVLFSCWKTKREGECPNHVVVLCNGHVWFLQPWDSQGEALNVSELMAQLTSIREQSDRLGPGPGVASLTFTPSLCDQACWESVCGDISNRWTDKSLSIIVTRSGYTLSNNDHTPYDAMVLVVLMHFQHRLLELLDVQQLRAAPVRLHLAPPQLLKFDLDPSLVEAIAAARVYSKTLTDNIEVSFDQYFKFGKNWMKEKKVHPDALVQMALQLAYYRTYGKMAPTYETATTRQFYHGRTETVRSCTPAAKAFAITMMDPSASVSTKAQAVRAACAGHDAQMRECQAGQGVDRHLLGLYITALEAGQDVPAIFTDPAFVKSGGGGNYVLSTSTLGYTDCTGGVAPMVQHGYGCFYTMLPNRLYLFVSSFRDGGAVPAPEFLAIFKRSLDDIKEVLDAESALAKL
ncbi:peroxisomal carnitine O-octanoyltransferase-like [Hyalella azteca]|uniref:Peroxisomal carnitine O-octanoyltransferase-like n=1 Tax=Hyalella azteca TaxID=294128 RepID=A0A979FUE5_HYAAZ|nr:peroxisomal carnitine O-octanoyltransferase-like [Hyalella azteca]